jgi:hypothetical protein
VDVKNLTGVKCTTISTGLEGSAYVVRDGGRGEGASNCLAMLVSEEFHERGE